MSEQMTISPEEPATKGMDYAWLKAEGLKLVQQSAGDIWTDYDEHEPARPRSNSSCYAIRRRA